MATPWYVFFFFLLQSFVFDVFSRLMVFLLLLGRRAVLQQTRGSCQGGCDHDVYR
jgi:hypothetical protein